MRRTIPVVMGLVVAMAAWGYVRAVETKSGAAPAAGKTAPAITSAESAAVPAARGASAKPSDDPAAQRKARSPGRVASGDEDAARLARKFTETRRTLMGGRPALQFENTAIKDVLNYLSEVGKFSIVFEPALEEAGIDLSARTVTIRASGMTYEDALNLVLPRECGYRIGPGYVAITTLEKSWVPLKTGVYSIRLALAEVPNFTGAPRFQVSDVLSGSGPQGGGGSLFGTTAPAPEDAAGKVTPDRIIEMIKKFVKNQNDRRIAPWDDEGGPATVNYIGGRLVVSQTDHGHRAVAQLLAKIE